FHSHASLLVFHASRDAIDGSLRARGLEFDQGHKIRPTPDQAAPRLRPKIERRPRLANVMGCRELHQEGLPNSIESGSNEVFTPLSGSSKPISAPSSIGTTTIPGPPTLPNLPT